MGNEISNKYIENAINELERFFGIKEPISGENIFSLIRRGKVKDAIKLIARQIDLPIDINITNVPNDYRSQKGESQFQSTHLVNISQHGSRGSAGIIAQVSIPGNLPHYGSSALNGYPINVKISENCTENPVVFSMIMAHELSHVLLYSLMHPKKDNEFYTDLTAIMLGFKNIFQNGRKITTTEEEPGFMSTTIKTSTTTYGYLTDGHFDFARNKITSILEKNRERKKLLSEKLNKFKKLLSKYNKTFGQFKNFIEYLSKNRNKNISGEDSKKIIVFFQLGYIDELGLTIKQYEQKIKTIEVFCKDISHYIDQKMNQISYYIQELQDQIEEFKNKQIKLKRDVKMLSKYISLAYRIKRLKNKYCIQGRSENMKKDNWLRWVSFFSGFLIFFFFIFNVKEFTGSKVEVSDIGILLLVAILPAIIASLLGLFCKFWWLLPFAVWFMFLGTGLRLDSVDYSWILVIASSVLFFSPFINMALRRDKT